MFWDRLYHLCTKNNFKPNTVAKAIGLSTATATKWKNGSVRAGEHRNDLPRRGRRTAPRYAGKTSARLTGAGI